MMIKTDIPSTLIQQNCFIKLARDSKDLHKPCANKKYWELQRTLTSNGYKEELVELDYPITPDSVKSYADSADYHSDPNGAVARGQARENLGDITEMQEVSTMDTEQAKAIYQKVIQDAQAELAKLNATKNATVMKEETPNV